MLFLLGLLSGSYFSTQTYSYLHNHFSLTKKKKAFIPSWWLVWLITQPSHYRYQLYVNVTPSS